MHAKKTRDRKKLFLQASEQIIREMEADLRTVRDYLVSIKLLSHEDAARANQHDLECKEELARLKV
jgi:hypothetical protein